MVRNAPSSRPGCQQRRKAAKLRSWTLMLIALNLAVVGALVTFVETDVGALIAIVGLALLTMTAIWMRCERRAAQCAESRQAAACDTHKAPASDTDSVAENRPKNGQTAGLP